MDLNTMKLFADALQAAKEGNKEQALALADRYAVDSARSFLTSDSQELAMIIAPLVNFYENLGEWELAALKSKDVCALAEKLCPDTAETAGDYSHLATALEHLGDYLGAITALEHSVRHLKGAGEWEEYAEGYEKDILRLRKHVSSEKSK